MIFVCSMSDLFHEAVDDLWLLKIFDVMRLSFNMRKGHVFQILTKRPGRAADFTRRLRFDAERPGNPIYLESYGGAPGYRLMGGAGCTGLTNIWLGTSVERQKEADMRIGHLLDASAAVKFISYEPALGPLDLRPYLPDEPTGFPGDGPAVPGLDWVIAGGESGPGHRPADPQWFEDVHTQCLEHGVPFFMKQDSGPRPGMQGRIPDDLWGTKELPIGQAQEVTA